jgi:hypothetical protein
MLAATAAQVNCVGGANGDVPTEISLADCDAVAQTLLSNNAYTIADTVEGENKFGKMCAEVKLSLIDLETEVAFS